MIDSFKEIIEEYQLSSGPHLQEMEKLLKIKEEFLFIGKFVEFVEGKNVVVLYKSPAGLVQGPSLYDVFIEMYQVDVIRLAFEVEQLIKGKQLLRAENGDLKVGNKISEN